MNDPLDILEADDAAREKAQQQSAHEAKGGVRHIAAVLDEAVPRLRARFEGKEKPVPLKPWPTLAEKLGGGLWPGVHLLVGGTGSGKSQFAFQAAVTAAASGTPVLYAGLELGPIDLSARILSVVDRERKNPPFWSKIFLGQTQVDDADIEAAKKLPLYATTPGAHAWGADDLKSAVAEVRAQHPEKTPGCLPLLVVVDFLQLIGDDEEKELRIRIAKATYAARAVSQEHNAAVLLVSSTARENYAQLGSGAKERDSGRTQLALGEGHPGRLVGLGKESGELEYSAETVLVLGRSGDMKINGAKCDRVHLAIAKGRAVKPDWVELWFTGNVFLDAAVGRLNPKTKIEEVATEDDSGKSAQPEAKRPSKGAEDKSIAKGLPTAGRDA